MLKCLVFAIKAILSANITIERSEIARSELALKSDIESEIVKYRLEIKRTGRIEHQETKKTEKLVRRLELRYTCVCGIFSAEWDE